MMNAKATIKKYFFLIYLVVIVLILIYQLSTCGSESYSPIQFGSDTDVVYHIIDKNVCELVFRISKENPDGFMLHNFQRDDNLKPSDAKIYIAFWNESIQTIIQQTEIDPWAETNDIYIKFDQQIPVGTNIRMRLWSKGFEKKGSTLSISKTILYGNSFYKNGELVNSTLNASLYYKTMSYSYLKPIICFFGELLIGIILIFAYKKLNLPLYVKRPAEKVYRRKLKRKWPSIVGVLITFIIATGFLEYIYSSAVKQWVEQRDCQMIIDQNEEEIQHIVLEEGDEISQIIDVSEGTLSGIGLWFKNGNVKKGTLNCQIYDFVTGNLVTEKNYKISDLKTMSFYAPTDMKTDDNEEILKAYRVLPFQPIFTNSDQQKFKIKLRVKKINDDRLVLKAAERESFPLQINQKNTNVSLCVATLYSSNYCLKTMFFWMAAIILVLLCVSYLWIYFFTIPVSKIFLITALILGFIYSFLIPAYCVPDEAAHTDAVYSISNRLLGISEIPGPNRIYKRTCDIKILNGKLNGDIQYQYKKTYDDLFTTTKDETLQIARNRSPVNNVTTLHYLPAAIGFTFARVLHFNHFFMHLLGRLFNMAAMIYLIYIAIRKMPFAKPLIAVLGLLPMTLQQIASVSYDGLIIASAYVFTAYCFHLLWEKNISVTDIAVTVFSGCILTMSKAGVYIPLLGLFLLVPYMRKSQKKKWFVEMVLALTSLAIMFTAQFSPLILSILGRRQATVSLGGTATSLYTVAYLIENPKALIRIFENTFWEWGDYYLRGMLGSPLGVLNVSIPWFILIAFLILLLLCAMKHSHDKDNWTKISRTYGVFLCLASIMLILTSLLLTWTRIGETSVQGIQGRYFLPLAVLGFILLRTNKVTINNIREDCLVYLASILNVFAICGALLSIFKIN